MPRRLLLVALVSVLLWAVPAAAITRTHANNSQCTSMAPGGTTVCTSDSITPTANELVTIQLMVKDVTGGDPGTPTVTGNGITYAMMLQQAVTTTCGSCFLYMFRGMAASPSAGVVTFTFGTGQFFMMWNIERWGGVPSGSNGASAVGTPVGTSGVGTSLSVTIAALGTGSVSYGAMSASDDFGAGFTAGSGYSDTFGINAISFNPGTPIAVSHGGEMNPTGSTTVNFTYSPSASLGLIGFEIKSSGGVVATPVRHRANSY